jgi:acetyl esterase
MKKPVFIKEVQAFLEARVKQPQPSLASLPLDKARMLFSASITHKSPRKDAEIEDRELPIGPSGKIAIRIVRPKKNDKALPIIMYFHGGGWVFGNKETHDHIIRELAVGAHAAVVFVEYTPSPEAKYPQAQQECYLATKWVADNADPLSFDANRIALVGDSVGGNMVTTVAQLIALRGGPKIGVQVLFYPVTNANFDTASYQEFGKGFPLSSDLMMWFWDQYAPDKSVRSQSLVSPLNASIKELQELPRALIVTGEYDILRDEGEDYARKLIQAGIPVAQMRVLGLIHDFLIIDQFLESDAVRAVINLANETLREFFY